jgi:hypothetical protein
MRFANGPDDFRSIHQVLDRLNELVAEVLALFREVAGQVVSFQVLPKSLDRVEVGAVRWQIHRLDVMPTQALGFMPAGVVEDEQNAFASTLRHLCGHRIKEDLENRRVAMRNDQAHQLAGRGIDRADDILPDVTPLVGLGRSRAPLDPFMARPRISFEPGFIAKEDFTNRVFQQCEELKGEGFARVFPSFAIRRLWHGPGNLTDARRFPVH